VIKSPTWLSAAFVGGMILHPSTIWISYAMFHHIIYLYQEDGMIIIMMLRNITVFLLKAVN
jgi:hypothetical protein